MLVSKITYHQCSL